MHRKDRRGAWTAAWPLALACAAVMALGVWQSPELSNLAPVPESDRGAIIVTERAAGLDERDVPEAGDEDEAAEVLQQAQPMDMPASTSNEPFVMPEGAEYVPDVVLVAVDPDTDPQAVEEVLAAAPGVEAQSIDEGDMATGLIEVAVEPGTSVEDAVNALLDDSSGLVNAQPNYVYHLMEAGTPEDLHELVDVLGEDAALPEAPYGEGTDGVADADAQPEGGDEVPSDEGEASADGSELDTDDETPSDEAAVDGGEDVPADAATDAEELPEVDADEAAEPTGAEDPDAADAAAEPAPEEAQTLLAQLDVSDPYARVSASSEYNWDLTAMQAYKAWSVARCEQKVTVAVLDQGIDTAHEDLKANVVGRYNAYAAQGGGTGSEAWAATGHGTHVAGIVSAVADNGLGVAGISYNAGILAVNVFDDSGASSTLIVKRAYDYIASYNKTAAVPVRVVNLSLGIPYTAALYKDTVLVGAIDDAYTRGIVTVASAGNSDLATTPYEEYPGDLEHVVSVINVNDSLKRDPSSNYNTANQQAKNISAPGTDIYSTVAYGSSGSRSYATMSGTSMAAPQVAGVLALEFAANPSLTAEGAVRVLYASARDLGASGWDREYGYGLVDAYAAVTSAKRASAGGSTPSAQATTWHRLWGQTALDTMAAIVSEGGFSKGGTVVLATSGGYWDALTAAGVAGMAEAPVVMTTSKTLSTQAASQLAALKPKTIIVCGGSAAIAEGTASAAAKAAGGAKVVRLWGQTAYDTADQIFLQAEGATGGQWATTGFVCTGAGYWDALSAAPLSYALHMPIFLTKKDSISASTIQAMKKGGVTSVYIVGGTAAISDAVVQQLKAAGITIEGRLWGQTAIDTSEVVAEFGLSRGMLADGMGVATSSGYWDALAGAAFCGRRCAPIVLVSGPTSSTITLFAKGNRAEIVDGYVFGGTVAVSKATYDALVAATK